MTDDQIREAIRWARFSPEERKAAARSDGHIIGVDYHTQKSLDLLASYAEAQMGRRCYCRGHKPGCQFEYGGACRCEEPKEDIPNG